MVDNLLCSLQIRCFLNDVVEDEAQIMLSKNGNVTFINITDFKVYDNYNVCQKVILYEGKNIITLLDECEKIIKIDETDDKLTIITNKSIMFIEYL